MEKGMPIGCAPNVHVSLVMLPEECASLTSRRYPFKELRRRAMKAVVGRQIRKRLTSYDARFGNGRAAA
jgi:hypothetical protein